MANWMLMPVIDCLAYTRDAVADCLAQEGVDPHVLIIDNGSGEEARVGFDQLALDHEGRVLVWHHDPCLPSLSATWNTALQFVWDQGGTEALVLNNDVRLRQETLVTLQGTQRATGAYFVSAVGVREAEWDPEAHAPFDQHARGGPDFSCFLLTRAGHAAYPFDEGFHPCYCEDLDMHRRYMLGGDGGKIFSITLPFLHYASRTINRSAEAKAAWAQISGRSREYYRAKWGGDVNQEAFLVPFTPLTSTERESWDRCHVTTPELQRFACDGRQGPSCGECQDAPPSVAAVGTTEGGL
jgi:hypothetical protein